MTFFGRAKTARAIILVIGCAALLTAVAVFIGFRMATGRKGRQADVMPAGVEMALGSIDHTATQDGKTRWQLKAKAGQLERASSSLLLKEIDIVFFLDNGQQATVEASEGSLNTVSNDIEVSGDVVVISQGHTLTSAKMHYNHQRQVIASDVPVRLTHQDSWLDADSMVYDLTSNRAEFIGRVRAQMGDSPLL